MSLIITVYTNEGIVMASDSRLSLTTTTNYPDGRSQRNIGSHCTDTTYKTFIATTSIGISACGVSLINEMPLSSYIMKFIAEKASEKDTVENMTNKLFSYFRALDPDLDTHFIVAGYDKNDLTPKIRRLNIKTSKVEIVDASKPGATFNGEVNTLCRLLFPVAQKHGSSYSDLPHYDYCFTYFTLQDAVDFAKYAVDVTIKTMQFTKTAKTVGGPIDILAIKPDGAFWVKHRELKG